MTMILQSCAQPSSVTRFGCRNLILAIFYPPLK